MSLGVRTCHAGVRQVDSKEHDANKKGEHASVSSRLVVWVVVST